MLEKATYKDIARYAWSYWRKQKVLGFVMVAMMIAATIINAIFPIYTGAIVDVLVAHEPHDEGVNDDLLQVFIIFLVLSVFFHLLRYGAISLWVKFAARCLYEIMKEAFSKVQRFSTDWHANSFAGGTVRKMSRGMWAFDVFGDTLFLNLLPAIIVTIGITTMLLIKLPYVGLYVAVMMLLYGSFSIWCSVKILAPIHKKSADSDTHVGAVVADAITGNPTVKTFGAEKREETYFLTALSHWNSLFRKAWLSAQHVEVVRGFLRMFMLFGMLGITTWMWKQGSATPGDLALAFNAYIAADGYFRDVGMHISNLQKSISEMQDIVSFWKRKDELSDDPGAKPIEISKGVIKFDHVTFTYQGKTEPLFDGLSLDIHAAEKIALVGHSGSGKSTIVKLIQRLYDVNAGDICIDGQNIATVQQDSLRSQIALVPQDPILFHRSIAENIAYGRPNATIDEVIEAAQKAYAHDFIELLPNGYDTLVGERGVKLSGGERQRVAVARAILADCPILILDEATSALDSISESYIQKAMRYLTEGRTTITIAHRLSTIKDADRILVFDKGQIIEQGSHEELIQNKNSHYKELYEMQKFI